jgi:aminoglycoside phosphotransferase (APT) family kinase protein
MAYTPARGDVGGGGDVVRKTLDSWLPPRLAPAGARSFAISSFSSPDAGYSGKTVLFTAEWIDLTGRHRTEDLVLRMQADSHQLFTTPDAPRQAEVMQRLGAHGIPVPHIVGIERDASVLGSPFYLMRRVHGRTPSDVPSWHKRGWTAELSASERELLCDNALRELVAVHRVALDGDLRCRHHRAAAIPADVGRLVRVVR